MPTHLVEGIFFLVVLDKVDDNMVVDVDVVLTSWIVKLVNDYYLTIGWTNNKHTPVNALHVHGHKNKIMGHERKNVSISIHNGLTV
jgi:hypothetical protein